MLGPSSREICQPVAIDDRLSLEHSHHPNCHNGIHPFVRAARRSLKGDMRKVFDIILCHRHGRSLGRAWLILVIRATCDFPNSIHQYIVPIVGLQSVTGVEYGERLGLVSASPIPSSPHGADRTYL